MRFLVAVFLIFLVAVQSPARATVSTTSSAVTAQGNSVTTQWNYSFPIPNAGDVVVTVTNTTVTPPTITTLSSTQFTITGIGSATGGTVTYPLSGSPLATGFLITISRIVPLVQTTSLCSQGPPFCAVEHALDYLTYIAQQLYTDILGLQAEITNPSSIPIPIAVRIIPSGSTDTAVTSIASYFWNSATTLGKTETLYTCNSTLNGQTVTVADMLGTASIYPITVVPAAGNTIWGTASSFPITWPKASITFQCDGVSNWTPI